MPSGFAKHLRGGDPVSRKRRRVAGRVERAGKDLAKRPCRPRRRGCARGCSSVNRCPVRPGRRPAATVIVSLKVAGGLNAWWLGETSSTSTECRPAARSIGHVPHVDRRRLHAVDDDREVVLRRRRGHQRTTRPGTPQTVRVSGEPTSAPGAGDTIRTGYGAATRSAGLNIQLATRPPAPHSAATPPAMRYRAPSHREDHERAAEDQQRQSPLQRQWKVADDVRDHGRLGQAGATVKKIVGVTSRGLNGK